MIRSPIYISHNIIESFYRIVKEIFKRRLTAKKKPLSRDEVIEMKSVIDICRWFEGRISFHVCDPQGQQYLPG